VRCVGRTIARGVIALVVLSCGADPDAPISPDDFLRLSGAAFCDNIGPCCQNEGFPYDPVMCRATMESSIPSALEKVKLPGIAYDGHAARACLDASSALVKACADPRQVPKSCQQVFMGTFPIGEECISPDQCVPGASCYIQPPAPTGRCASSVLARGKAGETCVTTCSAEAPCTDPIFPDGTSPHTACFTDDNLYCSADHVCARPAGLNEACTGRGECVEDIYCGAMSVCVAKPTTGPCGATPEGCSVTAYCDDSLQCQPRAAPGEACAGAIGCPEGYVCNGKGVCSRRGIASYLVCQGQ
jgi:hypothetical protein